MAKKLSKYLLLNLILIPLSIVVISIIGYQISSNKAFFILNVASVVVMVVRWLLQKSRIGIEVRILLEKKIVTMILSVSLFLLIFVVFVTAQIIRKPEISAPEEKANRVRTSLPMESPLCTLYVFSDPKAAKIIIDGKFYGNTNRSIYLQKGTYGIQIKKEGYLDHLDKIVIPNEKIHSVILSKK